MDARHFDTLVRSLSERGSRRGLLGLLKVLPLVSGLITFLDADEAAAKGQRKRHKKPHHHRKHSGNRAGKKKKRRCKPNSKAKTCAGKCGAVKDNCKKTIDCGSCACDPPCDVCFSCQEGPNTPGACVADPEQEDDACGEPGQVCQADGACSCDAESCSNPTPSCLDSACTACTGDPPCPAGGCCDGATGSCITNGQPCGTASCASGTFTPEDICTSGVCAPGTPVSCAPYADCAGEVCATTCQDDDDCVAEAHCNGASHCMGDRLNGETCAHGGQCQSGHCVDDVCCASATCTQCHACDVPGQAGSCAPQPYGTTCNDDDLCTTNDVCTAGVCGGTPVVCNACQLPGTCDPDSGECQPDPAKRHTCDGPCPSGQWCDAGACADIQATVTLPDCQSLCDASTTVCGQMVTCPSCFKCVAQTGCAPVSPFPDGPVGPGDYCATTVGGGGQTCTTNDNCPPGLYCGNILIVVQGLCFNICPF